MYRKKKHNGKPERNEHGQDILFDFILKLHNKSAHGDVQRLIAVDKNSER